MSGETTTVSPPGLRAYECQVTAIVAVTDAGVQLDPAWLERLFTPLLADPTMAVAAGFFRSDPEGVFERALGARAG